MKLLCVTELIDRHLIENLSDEAHLGRYLAHVRDHMGVMLGREIARMIPPAATNWKDTFMPDQVQERWDYRLVVGSEKDLREELDLARKKGHQAGVEEGKRIMREQIRLRMSRQTEALLAEKVIG